MNPITAVLYMLLWSGSPPGASPAQPASSAGPTPRPTPTANAAAQDLTRPTSSEANKTEKLIPVVRPWEMSVDLRAFVDAHHNAVKAVDGESLAFVYLAKDEDITSAKMAMLNRFDILVIAANGSFLKRQRLLFGDVGGFANRIVTSGNGFAYYFSPSSGLWFCNPADNSMDGFSQSLSLQMKHSIGGLAHSTIWGVNVIAMRDYLAGLGASTDDFTAERVFLNTTLHVAFVKADGRLYDRIRQIVHIYAAAGELGVMFVPMQFVEINGTRVYVNVAELNGRIYVGQSADLLDVRTFLTDARYHELAKELLSQAVGGQTIFAAQVVWTVGWNMRGHVDGELSSLLQKMGTPPVESPNDTWGLTSQDGVFGIVPNQPSRISSGPGLDDELRAGAQVVPAARTLEGETGSQRVLVAGLALTHRHSNGRAGVHACANGG